MRGREVGLNHVAIAWPDRESWLKQLEYLQGQGRARSTGASTTA